MIAFELGHLYAVIGVILAVMGGGLGSAIALTKTGQAVAGLCSENSSLYGKVVVVQLLPATQGIYGFVVGILIMSNLGIIGGNGLIALSALKGLSFLIASLPVCIVGFFSAIYQGKAGCAAINMVGKDPTTSGKGVILAAVVEFYAILGMLASILLIS
ncbi:MAG: V-type ATP synthase subunit K [Clostridia bacterium]